jgi:23S rRNA (adenine-N6)-dimethyltransferase
VSGRCRTAPNPAGAHFLRDRTLITRLVGASGADRGQLVLDLGAGYGSITAALAAAGPRVIAIERDPRLADRLRRRFGDHPLVTVVAADLRDVPLPRRDFMVVASIPFALTTELLRRLLGDPSVPLAGAQLVLAWGAGRWLSRPRPRDEETAWWTARYRIRLAGRIPAASFAPPPLVDAAEMTIRPRPLARSPGGQRVLRALLRDAFRRPDRPVGVERRALLRTGIAPGTPAAGMTAAQWHRLAQVLARVDPGDQRPFPRCGSPRRPGSIDQEH